MNPLAQLEAEVRLFLAGERSVDELQDWLGSAALRIHGARAPDAERLSARVWRLISEYSLGHRSEESLRAELAAALEPVAAGIRVVYLAAAENATVGDAEEWQRNTRVSERRWRFTPSGQRPAREPLTVAGPSPTTLIAVPHGS